MQLEAKSLAPTQEPYPVLNEFKGGNVESSAIGFHTVKLVLY